MARGASDIGRAVRVLGGEPPFVAIGLETHEEDAERVAYAHLAVRVHLREPLKVVSTRSHHELTDAPRRVEPARRVLWREALVVVVVPVDDDVDPRRVQRIPEWPYRAVLGFWSGCEQW